MIEGSRAVDSDPLGDVDEEVAVSCRWFSAVVAVNCGNRETRGLEHEQELGVEVHPHRERVHLARDTRVVDPLVRTNLHHERLIERVE
jgi:hypothetical protein